MVGDFSCCLVVRVLRGEWRVRVSVSMKNPSLGKVAVLESLVLLVCFGRKGYLECECECESECDVSIMKLPKGPIV